MEADVEKKDRAKKKNDLFCEDRTYAPLKHKQTQLKVRDERRTLSDFGHMPTVPRGTYDEHASRP
ncbi:MAG: hypothetical protein ACPHGY_11575, partial [Rhodospirillaceae bacterium]